MTNPQEGRQPCPELAATWPIWLGREPGSGRVYFAMGQIHDDDLKVPCLVTPLLTADEREKLIGGEG